MSDDIFAWHSNQLKMVTDIDNLRRLVTPLTRRPVNKICTGRASNWSSYSFLKGHVKMSVNLRGTCVNILVNFHGTVPVGTPRHEQLTQLLSPHATATSAEAKSLKSSPPSEASQNITSSEVHHQFTT